MLTIGIHTLRNRLVESNERAMRLLGQAKDVNEAARELTLLSDPPAITALGAELAGEDRPAGRFRAPTCLLHCGSKMRSWSSTPSSTRPGTASRGVWPLDEHPGIAEAVATLRPVTSRLDPERGRAVVRDIIAAYRCHPRSVGAGVPHGELHGVLSVASRGTPVPEECVDRVR